MAGSESPASSADLGVPDAEASQAADVTLPVLFEEPDGEVIVRFSELFGSKEIYWGVATGRFSRTRRHVMDVATRKRLEEENRRLIEEAMASDEEDPYAPYEVFGAERASLAQGAAVLDAEEEEPEELQSQEEENQEEEEENEDEEEEIEDEEEEVAEQGEELKVVPAAVIVEVEKEGSPSVGKEEESKMREQDKEKEDVEMASTEVEQDKEKLLDGEKVEGVSEGTAKEIHVDSVVIVQKVESEAVAMEVDGEKVEEGPDAQVMEEAVGQKEVAKEEGAVVSQDVSGGTVLEDKVMHEEGVVEAADSEGGEVEEKREGEEAEGTKVVEKIEGGVEVLKEEVSVPDVVARADVEDMALEVGRGPKRRKPPVTAAVAVEEPTTPPEEWQPVILEPNLSSLHLDDWEERILWERNPGQASGPSDVEDEDEDEHRQALSIADIMDIDGEVITAASGRDTGHERLLEREASVSGRPITVEELGSPSPKKIPLPSHAFHPQMLRIESWLAPNEEEGEQEDEQHDRLARRLDLLRSVPYNKNAELVKGDWTKLLEDLTEDPTNGSWAPRRDLKLVFNLGDPLMAFEITEPREAQKFCAHASALVIHPSSKEAKPEAQDASLLTSLVTATGPKSHLTMFNVSNDKYYMNKKHKAGKKKHTSAAMIRILHATPALKLQTMKPKLTNIEMRNFHRPRAVWFPQRSKEEAQALAEMKRPLPEKGAMKVIVKSLNGKKEKLQMDASFTLEDLRAKIKTKWEDLKSKEPMKVIYAGKELEEGKTLAEQEVPDKSTLHVMRTKLLPLYNTHKHQKKTRPPNAFKRKQELSAKNGHIMLMEHCEERPLLLSNPGMGVRLVTYYRKQNATDTAPAVALREEGLLPLPLEPEDPAPFLGDVKPGECVTSLESNMARAPAFKHAVPTTDFLLVRTAKGKLMLRKIDSYHVLGQQEPHMEVFAPHAKVTMEFTKKRFMVYVFREFLSKIKKKGDRPRIDHKDLLRDFPGMSEGIMKKNLKGIADLHKTTGGSSWWQLRRNYELPPDEELQVEVTPEALCAYESMQAGLHRLKAIGIKNLTSVNGISVAMGSLPSEPVILGAAAFIERELQHTPWNLTANFVAATKEGRNNLEKLEITGPGDPTGRGLGFSYLRAQAKKEPGPGALVEKKAAVARGGAAVTGTDADLRRLSMENARQVLLKFQVDADVIEKWTRWKRIAMVRELSSQQAATSGGTALLHKFARGQRMSVLQVMQQVKEKCQDIWERQMRSLTAGAEDEEEEGSDLEDLDDFAGDLENLLEMEAAAEERDEARDEGLRRGRHRRAWQTQQEELEDEEAEAAELRRMLLEDEETEKAKKKKADKDEGGKKPAGPESQRESQPRGAASGGAGKSKKMVTLVKKKFSVRLEDGTYEQRFEMVTNPEEVARYLEKLDKLKKKKEKSAQVADAKAKAKKEKEAAAKEKGPGDKPKAPPKKKTTGEKKGEGAKEGADGGDKPKKAPPKKKPPATGEGAKKGEGGAAKLAGPKEKGEKVKQLICSACNEAGHMRTNKKCRLYREDEHGNQIHLDGAAAEGTLKKAAVEGGIVKWKLNKSMLVDIQKRKLTPGKPRPPLPTPLPGTAPRSPPKIKLTVKFDDTKAPSSGGNKDKKKSKSGKDKNKKKKKVNFDAVDDDLQRKAKRHRTSPEVDLANIFEKVVEALMADPNSELFRKPVTKAEAPDYASVVRNPIDLSKIREFARKCKYKNRMGFLNDIRLIADNAHLYNDGRNPQIPPLAERLVDTCRHLLDNRDNELSQAEDALAKHL